MQITDQISNPRLIIEQTRANTLQQLRPGQVIRGEVLTPVDKGIAQLNVGGIKMPVKTGLNLTVGQQLTLDVIKAGQAPEFRVIRAMEPHVIQAATLRSILPKQLPLKQLLDAFYTLRSTPESAGTSPPPAHKQGGITGLLGDLLELSTNGQPTVNPTPGSNPLERNLRSIANILLMESGPQNSLAGIDGPASQARKIGEIINPMIAEGQSISAETIRKAFELSGLFLESHLASGQPVGGDIKAKLLRLLAALQSLAPPHPTQGDPITIKSGNTGTTLQRLAAMIFGELHHLTEGALARVQLHQLTSLPQEDNPLRHAWQFELPIPHAEGYDDFMLQIERETNQTDPTDHRWSVLLHFDIAPAGPISARLSLVDDEISSHFTAEHPEGVTRLEASLPKLSEALQRAGLKTGRLTARQGVTTPKPDHPSPPFPLLDEKA